VFASEGDHNRHGDGQSKGHARFRDRPGSHPVFTCSNRLFIATLQEVVTVDRICDLIKLGFLL
jgi:hypothetical protein